LADAAMACENAGVSSLRLQHVYRSMPTISISCKRPHHASVSLRNHERLSTTESCALQRLEDGSSDSCDLGLVAYQNCLGSRLYPHERQLSAGATCSFIQVTHVTELQ
jgi:hypothetical protein